MRNAAWFAVVVVVVLVCWFRPVSAGKPAKKSAEWFAYPVFARDGSESLGKLDCLYQDGRDGRAVWDILRGPLRTTLLREPVYQIRVEIELGLRSDGVVVWRRLGAKKKAK